MHVVRKHTRYICYVSQHWKGSPVQVTYHGHLIRLPRDTQLWVCCPCKWNRQKPALAASNSMHRPPPPTPAIKHACIKTKSIIPVSPASALKTFLARTQICSWARRGTSWCLLSCQGAPTHSCRDAWGERWSDAAREVESRHGNQQGHVMVARSHTCSICFKDTEYIPNVKAL